MSDAAIFIVTAGGRILHANATADQWWQLDAGALIGDLFPNLFLFEVTSSDAEWLETQWQVIVDTAQMPEGLPLSAQPRRGAPFEITVHLEKTSLGDEPGFFAYLRKASATAATPAAASGGSSGIDPQAKARIDLLEQRSQIGFFDLDYAQGRFHFSSVWKNLLGFVDSDLPNTESTWRDLIHPEDSAAAPDPESEGTPHVTQPFSIELRMRTKPGRWEWVLCSGAEVYGETGRLSRVVGTMLSIQERKEFEESCLASEERLGTLAGAGEVAAFDFDFAQKHHWIAPALRRMFDYRDAELPASPEGFAKLLPSEIAAAGTAAWFAARQPTATFVSETTALLAKTGHPVPVQAVFVRSFDRKRNLLRVVGHLRPAAASASALGGTSAVPLPHLRAAFDRLSEGVIITDASGTVTFANYRCTQLLGIAREQLEGRASAELITLVNRLNNQPVASAIARVLQTGEAVPLNDEHSIPTERGLRRVVFACDPVQDAESKTIGAVFVFRDPEEMTLTPDELVRSNRFESLGMLAGGIAHDFNNLLTTILGGISIARETRDYSQLEDAEKGCLAAKALTRQLLALARGGADLRQILNPAEVLRESVRLAAVGSPVRVDLQMSEELFMIHADKAEIIRVFQNLIINSIQAMPNGTGNVWVRAGNTQLNEGDVPPLARGDYVHIEVQDNGCGIPAEHLQKIFEPFFTTKRTGTGLGLATVISIIKTHGGQVGVSSTVGVGTTFSIFLPRADQPVAEIQRVAPTLRFGTGRILVMDDEEKILQLVGIMLDNLGYKFDVARNGRDAIALYQRYLNVDRPYDCVLLDLTIVGGMGGEETYQELKRIHPDVCAVISSGYDSEEMMRRYLDMGFRGYLSKPYRVGELGKLLKRVLGSGPSLSG